MSLDNSIEERLNRILDTFFNTIEHNLIAYRTGLPPIGWDAIRLLEAVLKCKEEKGWNTDCLDKLYPEIKKLLEQVNTTILK